MIRLPAVADRFYPGNPQHLARTLAGFSATKATAPARQDAIALVAPHAGYVYSGAVAAATFNRVNIPETVIVLGPNHTGYGHAVAVSSATWRMPQGDVAADTALIAELITKPTPIREDELAHRHEHSLEVQLPFLQVQQASLKLVPICLSSISYALCEEVGNKIARAVQQTGKKVLIVASSDMTHYESRAAASKKDHRALSYIDQMNPQGLYDYVISQQVSMCGVIPVSIALIAAKILGASRAELVCYTDSGAVSGDTDHVVGYAGLIIS